MRNGTVGGLLKNKKIYAAYEICTIFLAVVSIIIAIADITSSVTFRFPAVKTADTVIIVIFTIDYFSRLFLSSDKWSFFKANIFDLIAIIPLSSMFSLFRVARITRFARFTKAAKALRLVRITGVLGKVRRFIQTNGFIYMLYCALFLILTSSIIMTFVEFGNFEDSLWWSIVTVFTVGYGDISPTSTIGRLIAVILMLLGIGLVSSLTSTMTTYFSQIGKERPIDKLEQINLNDDQISELVKYAEEKFKKGDENEKKIT